MAKVADASKAFKQFEDRVVSLEDKFDQFIKTQGKTAKALQGTTKALKKQDDAVKKGITGVRNLRNEGDKRAKTWTRCLFFNIS